MAISNVWNGDILYQRWGVMCHISQREEVEIR